MRLCFDAARTTVEDEVEKERSVFGEILEGVGGSVGVGHLEVGSECALRAIGLLPHLGGNGMARLGEDLVFVRDGRRILCCVHHRAAGASEEQSDWGADVEEAHFFWVLGLGYWVLGIGYWAFGLSALRLSGSRALGLSGFRALGLSGFRLLVLSGFRAFGLQIILADLPD